MKAKKVTVNRKRERELDVALLDLSDEFGDVIDDSFLEEGVIDEDDE